MVSRRVRMEHAGDQSELQLRSAEALTLLSVRSSTTPLSKKHELKQRIRISISPRGSLSHTSGTTS